MKKTEPWIMEALAFMSTYDRDPDDFFDYRGWLVEEFEKSIGRKLAPVQKRDLKKAMDYAGIG